MGRDTIKNIKDFLTEVNDLILLIMPSLIFLMFVFVMYALATRGVK